MKTVSDFSQGKMNKDADVRYLPKGQYRHLLNGRVVDGDYQNSGVIEGVCGMEMVCREPFLFDESGSPTGRILGMKAFEDDIYVIGYGNIEALLFNLIIEIRGHGQVSRFHDKYKYEYGEEVLLNAIPDDGSVFVRYEGDLISLRPDETIIMNKSKSITAVFAEASGTEYVILFHNYINGVISPYESVHSSFIEWKPRQELYVSGNSIQLKIIEGSGPYVEEYRLVSVESSVGNEITFKGKSFLGDIMGENSDAVPVLRNEYLYGYVVEDSDDEIKCNWIERPKFNAVLKFSRDITGIFTDKFLCTPVNYICPDFENTFYYNDLKYENLIGNVPNEEHTESHIWYGDPSYLKEGLKMRIKYGFKSESPINIIEEHSGIIFRLNGNFELNSKEWEIVFNESSSFELSFKKYTA